MNAFYSSPSAYAAAKLEAPRTYSVNKFDLFPYADGSHSYWTGYFVSRAALKGYIRDSSSVFQAAKQVQLFTGGAADMSPSNPLYRFERSMGVVQHHDAVAGTAKQVREGSGQRAGSGGTGERAWSGGVSALCNNIVRATSILEPR